jgi:hypothetical protein
MKAKYTISEPALFRVADHFSTTAASWRRHGNKKTLGIAMMAIS